MEPFPPLIITYVFVQLFMIAEIFGQLLIMLEIVA